jgi:hypothetical protein
LQDVIKWIDVPEELLTGANDDHEKKVKLEKFIEDTNREARASRSRVLFAAREGADADADR